MASFDVQLELNDPALETALLELARRKWLLRALQAQRAQEELARSGILEARAVNGLGEVTRRVHAFAYHDWAQKLGSYECWHDKGFNRYYDKLAPETRVRCHGTRIQQGWRPAPEDKQLVLCSSGHKRFTKRYG